MERRLKNRWTHAAVALCAVLALNACSELIGVDETANLSIVTTQDDVKFITLRAPQNAVMEALHTGNVSVAIDGCVRSQEITSQPTIVWPQGYTLETIVGGHQVRREDGSVLGQLGEAFTFGGGVVEDVTAALGFTEQDQNVLRLACPGRFWIVGEVPAP